MKIAGSQHLLITLAAGLLVVGLAATAKAGQADFICDSVASDTCHMLIIQADGTEIRFELAGGAEITVGGLGEGDVYCDVLNEPADAATCDRFPVEGIE
jgi:hypothetical protein